MLKKFVFKLTEGFTVGIFGDGANINQNPNKADNCGNDQYRTNGAAQELNNRLFGIAGIEIMTAEAAQENSQ